MVIGSGIKLDNTIKISMEGILLIDLEKFQHSSNDSKICIA